MDKINNRPIGVFDSGVGGLTVAREIMRHLPDEDIVYFGDTARVPYGSKSEEVILHYSRQIAHFLKKKNVKAIVIACNTASAIALDVLQKEMDIPVIGVVIPGSRVAVETTENKKIGVIGTQATIKSGMYTKLMQERDPEVSVIGKACPLFVPLVEEGFTNHHITEEVIDIYLNEMKQSQIDTLILGCTHYPLLRSMIQKYMGEEIHIVNPAYETAMDLKRLLKEQEMEHDPLAEDEIAQHEFYASDAPVKFKAFANAILPYNIDWIEHINMEEF